MMCLMQRQTVWLCFFTDDVEIHVLDDGSYYFEIDGIPENDVDDQDALLEIDLKKSTKVQFSKAPIRVRLA